MIKVDNTNLDASDVYEKLTSVKMANRFFMDGIVLMLIHYDEKGICPTATEPDGAGVLYSFIEDKLEEVIEIFDTYKK